MPTRNIDLLAAAKGFGKAAIKPPFFVGLQAQC
jgi:hypothetical protein